MSSGVLQQVFYNAVASGSLETIQKLYDHPYVDATDPAILNAACKSGHADIVAFLLKNVPEADPSWNRHEPFQNAVFHGHPKVIEVLLRDARVDPTIYDHEALRIASQAGYRSSVAKILLADPRIDPTANNHKAFRLACACGSSEVVQVFLDDPRTDPAAESNDALIEACMAGNTQIVDLLLSHPRSRTVVDPAAQENLPLRIAARCGREKVVVRLLKDPRVDPSVRYNEAIRIASERMQIDVVKHLLTDPRVDVHACEHFVLMFTIALLSYETNAHNDQNHGLYKVFFRNSNVAIYTRKYLATKTDLEKLNAADYVPFWCNKSGMGKVGFLKVVDVLNKYALWESKIIQTLSIQWKFPKEIMDLIGVYLGY